MNDVLSPPSPRSRRPGAPISRGRSARTTAAIVAVAAIVLGAGAALAAVTVQPVRLTSGGVDQSEGPLLWWTQASTGLSSVPSPVPAAASTNASEPTVLASAGENFALDPSTAGDVAVEWVFSELPTAPASSEVEIVFEETVGAASSAITVFVETPTSPPGSALAFSFFLDAGPHPAALSSWLEVSETCGSVGSCP
jgi:hypothetical protein